MIEVYEIVDILNHGAIIREPHGLKFLRWKFFDKEKVVDIEPGQKWTPKDGIPIDRPGGILIPLNDEGKDEK